MMSIILNETANTSQSGKSTREFVTMEDTKLGESQRQVTIRSNLVIKHNTMARAIHWLHSKALTLNLPCKHIFFICGIMARSLPQIEVENVRSANFLVSSYSVLLTDNFNKFKVNFLTVWVEEGRTWGPFMGIK